MDELARYFEYKNDIRSLLILPTRKESVFLMRDVCENLINLEKVWIICPDADYAGHVDDADNAEKEDGAGKRDIIRELQFQILKVCGERRGGKRPDVRRIPVSSAPESGESRKEEEDSLILPLPLSDTPDAFVFDEGADFNLICAGIRLGPRYLSGWLKPDGVSCFSIFEQAGGTSEHILLKVRHPDKVETFRWNRGEYDVLLSVIFPVYNVAGYLDRLMDGLLKWEAPYVEYLFVNDGSPDNSRDIILQYAGKDPRVILIDKENGGCASARQKGLEEARGEYVGFVDPDDFVDPTMFQKLLERAMTGEYEVAYCGYNEYYENDGTSKPIPDALGPEYTHGTIDTKLIQNLLIYLRVAIWRGIYRKDFLNRSGIRFQTNLRRFDDLPFKEDVFLKARSVAAVPEYLYYYRLGRQGQDVSADDERLYVHFDIFPYLDRRFQEVGNGRAIDLLQVCKVETHNFALSKIRPEFRKEYMRRAKEDLSQNGMTVKRTKKLLKRFIGGDLTKEYLEIMKV